MNCKRALALPALLTMLGACSTPSGLYPSLAIRDAERVAGTMQPAEPEPYVPPPTPPQVIDRIEQLAADAASAHRRFVEQASGSVGAIAAGRGAAVGSDAWADALVALAQLDTARSRTMVPLADLDALFVEAATQGENVSRIAAVREQVIAMVAAEDETIDSLDGGRR